MVSSLVSDHFTDQELFIRSPVHLGDSLASGCPGHLIQPRNDSTGPLGCVSVVSSAIISTTIRLRLMTCSITVFKYLVPHIRSAASDCTSWQALCCVHGEGYIWAFTIGGYSAPIALRLRQNFLNFLFPENTEGHDKNNYVYCRSFSLRLRSNTHQLSGSLLYSTLILRLKETIIEVGSTITRLRTTRYAFQISSFKLTWNKKKKQNCWKV